MTVAIIDYGSGNLRSAAKAFERAASESGLNTAITVTADAEVVRTAERIVLPGVGAFADCLAGLTAVPGMIAALEESVRAKGRPFFGICVGMQLMAARGHEHGDHDGFGWIDGDVTEIVPSDPALKVPHMGWNALRIARPHAIVEDIADGDHAYFVHSYQFAAAAERAVIATVDYEGPIVAMVARDNMVGSQFHPEKSQRVGLKVIRNFLRWSP